MNKQKKKVSNDTYYYLVINKYINICFLLITVLCKRYKLIYPFTVNQFLIAILKRRRR